MPVIKLENIDDRLAHRLKVRAALNCHSVEEEVLEIVRKSLGPPYWNPEPEPPKNLLASIRARVEPLGGIELGLPTREPMREPPKSD